MVGADLDVVVMGLSVGKLTYSGVVGDMFGVGRDSLSSSSLRFG